MTRCYVFSQAQNAKSFAQTVGAWKQCKKVFLLSDFVALRQSCFQSSTSQEQVCVVIDATGSGSNFCNLVSALKKDSSEIEVVVVLEGCNITLKERYVLAGANVVLDNTQSFLQQGAKDLDQHVEGIDLELLRRSLDKKLMSVSDLDLDEPDGLLCNSLHNTSRCLAKVLFSHKQSNVISFVSGRGGVGKTSIVSIAGALASKWGLKTVLVDLDLSCGNLFSYFGQSKFVDISTSDEPKALSDDKLLYMIGSLDVVKQKSISPERVSRVIRELSGKYDLVLIDTGHAFDKVLETVVLLSDRIVFVADERASSASSLFRAHTFTSSLHVPKSKCFRLINHCDIHALDKKFIDKVEVGFGTKSNFKVEDGGYEYMEAMSLGHALEFGRSQNPSVLAIGHMLVNVLKSLGKLPEDKQAQALLNGVKKNFIFSSLFSGKKAS